MKYLKKAISILCATGLLIAACGFKSNVVFAADADPDADYDRLDGMGKSGEKVQVIEWEGNLEIHVYPRGSLKGLALKLDRPGAKTGDDKRVMVIGYRFAGHPKQQVIRRNILGIPMTEGFKAYLDPTEEEFDKVIISNNGMASPLALYQLDPTPTQLYPDENPEGGASEARNLASSHFSANGVSGNVGGENSSAKTLLNGAEPQAAVAKQGATTQAQKQELEESGTIQPFFSNSPPQK